MNDVLKTNYQYLTIIELKESRRRARLPEATKKAVPELGVENYILNPIFNTHEILSLAKAIEYL